MAEHLWTRRREGVRLRESRPTPPRGTHATRSAQNTDLSRRQAGLLSKLVGVHTSIWVQKRRGAAPCCCHPLGGARMVPCAPGCGGRDGSPLSALSRGVRGCVFVCTVREKAANAPSSYRPSQIFLSRSRRRSMCHVCMCALSSRSHNADAGQRAAFAGKGSVREMNSPPGAPISSRRSACTCTGRGRVMDVSWCVPVVSRRVARARRRGQTSPGS